MIFELFRMKLILKLTFANIKMYFRDKSALFWTLFFPFVIIGIFGILDFAKFSTSKVGIIYDDQTKDYALPIKNVLDNIGDHYKIFEGTLDEERKALEDDDRLIVLEFKLNPETQKVNVHALLNKSNEQGAQSVLLIVQKVLADFSIEISQVQPIFEVSSEVINVFDLRQIDFMVPGVVAMALMQGGIFGVVGTIVSYREKGILKRLFATPLSKGNFLVSQILSRLVVSILQVIILIVTSYVVFQIKIVGSILLLGVFAVLGSITFLVLGFAISGIAKTSESARAIAMPIQMIMMFTSGVYFPREVLPDWLYKITNYVPLTYLADGLRYIMTRGFSLVNKEIEIASLGLSLWFIIFLVLAIKSFKWEK